MREQGSLVEGIVNKNMQFPSVFIKSKQSLNATKMFSGAGSWMRECKQITIVAMFKDHLFH